MAGLFTCPRCEPPLGPGLIGMYEHELAAFDGLGLTDVQMDDCLQRPYRWHASPG
jgi:hypothetical protein